MATRTGVLGQGKHHSASLVDLSHRTQALARTRPRPLLRGPGPARFKDNSREGAQVRPSFTLEQAAFPPFPVSDELRTLCAQQGLSPDITAFPGAAPTVVRAEIPPGDAFTPREWGQAAAALVDEHLPATGALLFKNLPLQGTKAFSEFADGLQWTRVKYESAFASKRAQEDGIDLATNIPNSQILTCHNEMAYNPKPAQRIAFFCAQPAEQGGENILSSNHTLFQLMPPDIVARFAAKGGLKYTRAYRDPSNPASTAWGFPLPSWQQYTGTSSKEEAERHCRDDMGFNLSWDEQGTMHLSFTTSVVRKDPVTGQDMWFNSADLGSLGEVFHMTYGDGDAIDPSVISTIRQVRWQAVSALKLDAGDWLVLDNMRIQHGRLPYEGNERKMLVLMT